MRPANRTRRLRTSAPRGQEAEFRRGSITVFVLVCLVAITTVCAVLLRIGLLERQRVRAEERLLQAEWLVESGLERAVARMAEANHDYPGETWEISAGDLGGRDAGRLTIAVEASKDDPDRRLVRVQAEYPLAATAPIRLSKTWPVVINPASTSERP